MLTAIPNNIFSWDYRLFEDDRPIGLLDLAWFREKAKFNIHNQTYRISRESLLGGLFYLSKNDQTLAIARKSFTRSYEVQIGSEQYQLKAASIFSRTFQLHHNGHVVGTICPAHFLSLRAIMDLPNNLPIEAKAFLTFLAVILWRRQSQSD